MKKMYVVLIICAIILCTLLVVYFPPNFKTDKVKTITYGSDYKIKNIIATKFGKKLEDVKMETDLDSNKIGVYKVTYTVKSFGFTYKHTEKIKVVDDLKPNLSLKGNEETYVCPNTKYIEEGYEAIDNYDGNITKNVSIKEKNDAIIYDVMDSSKNKAEKIRNLIYDDKTAPVITLKGNKTITITKGKKYNEQGFSSIDNCDGDITKSVTIDNKVNSKQLGKYKVTYTSIDSANNKSVVVRTVEVIKQKTSNKGKNKTIYLTFDDGPSATVTPKLLKLLREENVKVTFFVINHDSSLDKYIKQEHKDGHTVGLHSYTHNYSKIYKSEKAFFNDLNKISNKVYKLTGERSKIIRFPGGASNTVSRNYSNGIMSRLTKAVEAKGYSYYDWNGYDGDAGETTNGNQMYKNVINSLSAKATIVLMHDFASNKEVVSATKKIIAYGKANGYTFDRITEDTPEIHQGVNN